MYICPCFFCSVIFNKLMILADNYARLAGQLSEVSYARFQECTRPTSPKTTTFALTNLS